MVKILSEIDVKCLYFLYTNFCPFDYFLRVYELVVSGSRSYIPTHSCFRMIRLSLSLPYTVKIGTVSYFSPPPFIGFLTCVHSKFLEFTF